MPERPRQHVIEQESRDAFRATLPAEWTVTPIADDYGIDARVEIFEHGAATGLAFAAQLKGTDKPDPEQALKRTIAVSTLNYLSAQADPVLVVRFHAPSRSLYGRWLHRKDVILKRKGQRTHTFSWAPSDLLDRTSALALHEEVRRFRRFSAAAGLDGLAVKVELDPELDAHGTAVTMLLNAASAAAGGFLRFGGGDPYDADLKITKKMLRVDMSITSARVEFPASDASAKDIAGNALTAAAVCLAKVGRPDVATSIVVANADAPLLANEEVAGLLAAAFGSAGRWREASDLARYHRNPTGGRSFFSTALTIELLLRADVIPPGDLPHLGSNLIGSAADMEAVGDINAGAAWYSAANFLFNTVCDYAAALDAYEKAASVRPDYLDQDYYLSELGAAQFETAAYDDAAETYERAEAADPANLGVIARRADALAHAGRYGDAIGEFVRYEAANGDSSPTIWALKAAALRTVVDRYGANTQQRKLAGWNGPRSDDIADDALSPRVWMAVAAAAAATGDGVGVLNALLVVCAFSPDTIPTPWSLAIGTAHSLGLVEVFDYLVHIGWARYGEQLVTDVLARSDMFDANAVDGLIDALKTKTDELRAARRSGVDLRIVHDDGQREVLRIYADG
jgi:tetratricopeptide (TPR) repeat protein